MFDKVNALIRSGMSSPTDDEILNAIYEDGEINDAIDDDFDDDDDIVIAENDLPPDFNFDISLETEDVPLEVNDYVTSIETQAKRLEQELEECDDLLGYDPHSSKPKRDDGDNAMMVYNDFQELKEAAAEAGMTVEEYRQKLLRDIDEDDFNEEVMDIEYQEISELQSELEDARLEIKKLNDDLDEEVTTFLDDRTKRLQGLPLAIEEGEQNEAHDGEEKGGNALKDEKSSQSVQEQKTESQEDEPKAKAGPVVIASEFTDFRKFIKTQLRETETEAEERRAQLRKMFDAQNQREEEKMLKDEEYRREFRHLQEREEEILLARKLEDEKRIEDEIKSNEEIMEKEYQTFQANLEQLNAAFEEEKYTFEQMKKSMMKELIEKRNKAAVNIQRVYRGHRTRCLMQAAIQDLAEMKELRKKEREQVRLMEIQYEMDLKTEQDKKDKEAKEQQADEDRKMEEELKKHREELEKQKKEEAERVAEEARKEEEKRVKEEKEEHERKRKEEEFEKKEEEKRKKEEERKRKEEEKKRKEEEKEEAKRKKEEEKKRKEEEKRMKEEEEKKKKEEDKKRKEEIKRKAQEEMRRKKEAEEEKKKLMAAQNNSQNESSGSEAAKRSIDEDDDGDTKVEKKEEDDKGDKSLIDNDNNDKDVKKNVGEGPTKCNNEELLPNTRDNDNDPRYTTTTTTTTSDNEASPLPYSTTTTTTTTVTPTDTTAAAVSSLSPHPPSSPCPAASARQRVITPNTTLSNTNNNNINNDNDNNINNNSNNNNNNNYNITATTSPEANTSLVSKSMSLTEQQQQDTTLSIIPVMEEEAPKEPNPTELLRLSWLKHFTPWSKVSNEPWKLSQTPTAKLTKRPTSAKKKMPPIPEQTVLSAAQAESLRQVSSVEFRDLPGYSLSTLSNCWNLRYLTVTHSHLVCLDGLASCKHVMYIDASNNEIEFVDLKDLGSLQSLNLSHNKLGSIHGIQGCINLRWLDLGHNNIGKIAGMSSLRRLHTLNVSHNQLTSAEGLNEAVTIQDLNLSHNFLQAFSGVTKLCLLTSLNLTSNNLLQAPVLKNNVLLKWLYLSENSLQSVQPLDKCWLPVLHHLDVSTNRLEHVDGIYRLPSLSTLDVSHNQIQDVDGLYPCLKSCKMLHSVAVAGNPLVDVQQQEYRGLIILASPSLKILDGEKVDGETATAANDIHQVPFSPKQVSIQDEDDDEALKVYLRQIESFQKLKEGFEVAVGNLPQHKPTHNAESLCSATFQYCDTSFKMAVEHRNAHEYGDIHSYSSSLSSAPTGNDAAAKTTTISKSATNSSSSSSSSSSETNTVTLSSRYQNEEVEDKIRNSTTTSYKSVDNNNKIAKTNTSSSSSSSSSPRKSLANNKEVEEKTAPPWDHYRNDVNSMSFSTKSKFDAAFLANSNTKNDRMRITPRNDPEESSTNSPGDRWNNKTAVNVDSPPNPQDKDKSNTAIIINSSRKSSSYNGKYNQQTVFCDDSTIKPTIYDDDDDDNNDKRELDDSDSDDLVDVTKEDISDRVGGLPIAMTSHPAASKTSHQQHQKQPPPYSSYSLSSSSQHHQPQSAAAATNYMSEKDKFLMALSGGGGGGVGAGSGQQSQGHQHHSQSQSQFSAASLNNKNMFDAAVLDKQKSLQQQQQSSGVNGEKGQLQRSKVKADVVGAYMEQEGNAEMDEILAETFDFDNLDFDLEKYLDLGELDEFLEKGWRPEESPQVPGSNYPVLGKINPSTMSSQEQPPKQLQQQQQQHYHHTSMAFPHPTPPPPSNPQQAWNNNSINNSSCHPAARHPNNMYSPHANKGTVPPLPQPSPSPSSVASAAETLGGGSIKSTKKKDELCEEWGFKDGKTAELMMARARKMKYNSDKKKKLSKLNPQERYQLFQRLEESGKIQQVKSRPPRVLPRKEYFQAREEEVQRQEFERVQEEKTRVNRTFEWLHTQVGDYQVSSSRINPGSGPVYSNQEMAALGMRTTDNRQTSPSDRHPMPPPSTMALEDYGSVSGMSQRRYSLGDGSGTRSPLLPPITVSSAPSHHHQTRKEKMSFRTDPVELSGGWGGGKKRNGK